MHQLSNEFLLQAYENAIKLNLCQEFIDLLRNEIEKRILDGSLIYYDKKI